MLPTYEHRFLPRAFADGRAAEAAVADHYRDHGCTVVGPDPDPMHPGPDLTIDGYRVEVKSVSQPMQRSLFISEASAIRYRNDQIIVAHNPNWRVPLWGRWGDLREHLEGPFEPTHRRGYGLRRYHSVPLRSYLKPCKLCTLGGDAYGR